MKKLISALMFLLVFFIFIPIKSAYALQSSSIKENNTKIQAYQKVTIKLNKAWGVTDSNLSNIVVSYDTDGYYKIDAKIKKQKDNTLVITPSVVGWTVKMNHYIILKQPIKNNAKKVKLIVISKFTVIPNETKIISGTIKLPNDEIANEDININIYAWSPERFFSNENFVIPKGSSNINYSIKVPIIDKPYLINYSLLSIDVNEPSYMSCYFKNAYVTKNGVFTLDQLEELAQKLSKSTPKDKINDKLELSFIIKDNLKLDIDILPKD